MTNTNSKKPQISRVGVVGEGRMRNAEAEVKKIELNEKINYQQVQQLTAKHEEEKFKTSIAWTKADTTGINAQIQEITYQQTGIERDIALANRDIKYVELGMIEDKLQLLEHRAELEHVKSVKQLEGMSIEIDQLEFKNNETKQIGEAFGVNYKQRTFPVQKIKSYLKEGL
ncbi:hypothetical protein IQ247_27150 [Plectonema cf. radiosum LEGE 06105]|uniref:Uncharacterized protein n=1 Tax=Plectonema cf. radiosum LEGE 06105 TaxID=945769 RepID=A0A8J7FN03_9CYAN|nr:hypothetical protein [Plectonema radiosum]MBE9216296.1 hypothetical protein [Plectonema cf. radiosum LEGE 06105]